MSASASSLAKVDRGCGCVTQERRLFNPLLAEEREGEGICSLARKESGKAARIERDRDRGVRTFLRLKFFPKYSTLVREALTAGHAAAVARIGVSPPLLLSVGELHFVLEESPSEYRRSEGVRLAMINEKWRLLSIFFRNGED